jgi:hypothetical protein
MCSLHSKMTNYQSIPRGDFKSLKLSDLYTEMLEDMYQAVTKADQWSYLSRPDVPGKELCPHCEGERDCSGKVYVSSRCMCVGMCRVCEGKGELQIGYGRMTPQSQKIDEYLAYGGHSGSSYSGCMAEMAYIAKNGWGAYVSLRGVKEPSLKEFVNSLEKSPTAHAIIPDLDEQLAGMRQYIKAVEDAQKDPSTWKKSAGFPYPCSCHRAKGLEGWCGVAGFGVPGCEH